MKRILLIMLVLVTAGMFMSISAQDGTVEPDCCCGGETEGCTEDCDTCDECDCTEDCGSGADCGCEGDSDDCMDDCADCADCECSEETVPEPVSGCGGCGGHQSGGCH